jgi:hypothetical protein
LSYAGLRGLLPTALTSRLFGLNLVVIHIGQNIEIFYIMFVLVIFHVRCSQ